MGVVQNIIGMVRDINDRKRASRVDEQLKNYLNDPGQTIAAIQDIDPRFGMALDRQRVQDDAAKMEALQKSQDRSIGLMRDHLRGLPEGADIDAAFAGMAPFMQQLGVPEQMYGGFQQAVKANPNALLDDKAYEAMMKDRFSGTVVTPGSIYMRGGKEVIRAPYAMKAETTPAGATTNIFDPNVGEFKVDGVSGAPAAGGGQVPTAWSGDPSWLTVDNLRPLFQGQESGFNHKAVNAETGALGIGQIMPDTGRALAKKAGLPWRPDMMKSDSPAAQRYQKAIGDAAMAESIAYGKGDPMEIFGHYYGGPDKRKWGPKTRRYQREMMDRLSGGPGNGAGGQRGRATLGPTATRTSVVNPKEPDTTSRNLSPEELKAAGYPDGAVVQRDSTGKERVTYKPPVSTMKVDKYDYDKAGMALNHTNSLLNEAKKVMKMPGLAGATGSFQGRMPGWMIGQSAQDARNALESLRSNVGLQRLMEAKTMSSQGASGFGNLSNAEGERLEKAFGSLNDTSSDASIRENLGVAVQTLSRASERITWQMQQAQAGKDWKVPPEGTVKNGYKFLGGSPANPRNWQKVKKGK